MAALAPSARANQEARERRDFPGGDGAAAQAQPAAQGVDYQAYTDKVVSRLSAPDFEPGNGFRQSAYGARSQQAVSAYTAQQRSLDREQLDNVRNLLGIDFFV